MGKVRNRNLYDYIIENYIEAKKPVTQQQIADKFELSLGAVKNFMARHQLNKKTYYAKYKSQVKNYMNKGLKAHEIALLMKTTPQHIYYLAKEEIL